MKKIIYLTSLVLSAGSANAGIYTKNLWTQNELLVCFAKGEPEKRMVGTYVLNVKDWSEKNKNNIKNWTNEEYTSERTGIHFVGWETCEETPNADIVIFYNKDSKILTNLRGGIEGLASGLGPATNIVSSYPLARSSVSISTSGMTKGTVLHEFGHVAGLEHEHTHPDADPKKCYMSKPFRNSNYVYETYDPLSIMSYCSLKRNALSEKDVELLKRLYP